MIILAEKFKGRGSQKGWEFELVERHGAWAIYKKTSESNVYYEVIRIDVRKATDVVFNGKAVSYPEREVYPKDEEFGQKAWSYGNKEDAYKRFIILKYDFSEKMMSTS